MNKNTIQLAARTGVLLIVMVMLATSCKRINHIQELEHVQYFIDRNSFNKNIAILVDFSVHSGKKRMFVYDMKTSRLVYSCLVAHGIGSGRKPVPERFSNVPGSLMSSLGLATIGPRDYSNWGTNFKYWLEGHESTNSNMRRRIVVLHAYKGVPNNEAYPRPIITSEGCLMVSNNAMHQLDKIIKSQQNKNIVVYTFQ